MLAFYSTRARQAPEVGPAARPGEPSCIRPADVASEGGVVTAEMLGAQIKLRSTPMGRCLPARVRSRDQPAIPCWPLSARFPLRS